MPFTYLDHTGDVGVELEAATLDELFSEAARAFLDTLTDPSLVEIRQKALVHVEAESAADLLVHWLEELLFLFDTRGLLAVRTQPRVQVSDSGLHRLVASIEGEEVNVDLHPQRVQIKAITYHQLEVAQEGERWRGRVIFDI